MSIKIELNNEQSVMLAGGQGVAKQMGMRLLLDMAAAAGATELIPIESAHLSGVSPLTGGLGLRQFLARLTSDPDAQVAVPTTLNAAGCDQNQFDAMHIVAPDFRKHSNQIVELYTRLGVQPTQSCVPYEWEAVVSVISAGSGIAAWAESNAICYGNSFSGILTNRESGLSALASALTGYTAKYGLLEEDARRPNLEVLVTARLGDPTDFSILGDWIGKQCQPAWNMPYGPIPLIKGLPPNLSHDQKKALAAAAANYGCPLLYIEEELSETFDWWPEAGLEFGPAELRGRYEELKPHSEVSLIVLGCPQASIGELRASAALLKGKTVTAEPAEPGYPPPLWLFTSSVVKAVAEKTGLADAIRKSGALLLENTCPEVVPYDQSWVKQILTNSLKAEHYIRSGLNSISTSVVPLAECIAVATGEIKTENLRAQVEAGASQPSDTAPAPGHTHLHSPSAVAGNFFASGHGLPSQGDFTITGEALVTDTPITFLGFVNRETGVIEERGHPAEGQSLAGKIAVFPRGSGSTVAPYVLLELYYRGMAPLAIVNTEIDQQSTPVCSLEGIPYAYGFDADIIRNVNHGDEIELKRQGDVVSLRVLKRVTR